MPSPARKRPLVETNAAATEASGASATASIRPSTKSDSAIAPIEARVALADDRDPDQLVDAARQRDPADGGAAAGGGERQHLRARLAAEEALPAERLEAVREQEETGGESDEQRVRAVDRPAALGEVARDQRPDDQHEADRDQVEDAAYGRARDPARTRGCIRYPSSAGRPRRLKTLNGAMSTASQGSL